MSDRMQQQRFELKYLIDEPIALRIRDFVRCHLSFDENSAGKPNFSYPVHSVYLDSDDLVTYWDTINGNKNRFKLRMRYYSAEPDEPVFFEIKRRMNNCIMKQRGVVRQSSIESLLAGHYPTEDMLISKNPRQYFALQNFCNLMSKLQARPKVHIAYLREAYVSDNDQVRVTIDRAVDAEANPLRSVKTEMARPARSFDGQVILELKYTNRFPTWFNELVRVFGVMQCGAAKYVNSIEAIGSRPPGCPAQGIPEGALPISHEAEKTLNVERWNFEEFPAPLSGC